MSRDPVTQTLPSVRRVVTGHGGNGIAILQSDDVLPAVDALPGVKVGPIWRTESVPTNDNNDDTDGAIRMPDGDLGMVMSTGTSVQFTDLAPGAYANMHRMSSLDHNILTTGRLILIMEDGSETSIKPGDVVVQRGTIHAWKNPGPEWARIITFIVAAQPAVVNGVALPPVLVY